MYTRNSWRDQLCGQGPQNRLPWTGGLPVQCPFVKGTWKGIRRAGERHA